MAANVAYTLREDKHGLQKQLGCMNGIFQLFDRRYLLSLHRSRSQNRLTTGEGENGEKEFKILSEKTKEKNPKKMIIEKNRASVESSRNSFSSSSSSTTFSSLDCSKRVQTEWQLPSEITSPKKHKKQPNRPLQPHDIRDAVKDSMIRDIRVTKDEGVGPMKHVDSPRPFIRQKSVQRDRKDQNLTKAIKNSSGVKELKETSRLSCDEREPKYSLKSTFKVQELPRQSLDSKQNSNRFSMNESRSEPGSNKRPSSGVVARLMGLESLTDSINEADTLMTKPPSDDQLNSSSRRSRKGEECKQSHGFGKPSVYGEMEKRLSALEFKTSGKDLRALKQILEAMQIAKRGLENKEQSLDTQKSDQPDSPTVKRTISTKRCDLVNQAVKPTKMATESMIIRGVHNVNRTVKKQVKDLTPRNKMSTTGRTPRSLSPSNSPEYVTGERPVSSPRLQRSKNGVNKQCVHGQKQSKVQPLLSDVKTRHLKINCITPTPKNKQTNVSQDGDTVSFKSQSKTKLEVTRNDQPRENLRVNEIKFSERSIEDNPPVDLARLTVEHPSPVSVLDTFYMEDTPSPVKKKPNALHEHETLQVDEREPNHVEIYNLVNSTDTNEYSGFNHLHQIELLKSTDETMGSPYKSTHGDHRYISDILLASGFLKDPDSAIRIVQLHPTANLIKPELFHHLEKTKGYSERMNDECNQRNPRSKSYEMIKRKLLFDSVNNILSHKFYVWSRKRSGRLVNGEKLLKELCSEIDNLQSISDRCMYDEDDEVKYLVSEDVNKSSEDWDKCCYEVPGVALDIERLIFKDLINEVVNADGAISQDRQQRYCRRLFSM